MLTLKEIKEGLQDRRIYVVAEVCGLSYPTIKAMADGEDKNFTIDSIKKVSEYLRKTSFCE